MRFTPLPQVCAGTGARCGNATTNVVIQSGALPVVAVAVASAAPGGLVSPSARLEIAANVSSAGEPGARRRSAARDSATRTQARPSHHPSSSE